MGSILPFVPFAARDYSPPAGFNPNSITGLSLWFAATNGPMTSGSASTNGQAVDTWADLSPSANNATSTLTARPTFVTNVINGLPVVRFDGTDDIMATSSMTLNQQLMHFIVIKIVTGGDGRYLWDGLSAGDRCAAWQEGTDGSVIHLTAGSSTCDRSYGTTNFVIVTARYAGAGSYQTVNNGAQGTGNIGAGNPGGLTLGNVRGGGAAGTVDIAEFLVYNNTVSAGNITLIQAYLSTKYGIAIS